MVAVALVFRCRRPARSRARPRAPGNGDRAGADRVRRRAAPVLDTFRRRFCPSRSRIARAPPTWQRRSTGRESTPFASPLEAVATATAGYSTGTGLVIDVSRLDGDSGERGREDRDGRLRSAADRRLCPSLAAAPHDSGRILPVRRRSAVSRSAAASGSRPARSARPPTTFCESASSTRVAAYSTATPPITPICTGPAGVGEEATSASPPRSGSRYIRSAT